MGTDAILCESAADGRSPSHDEGRRPQMAPTTHQLLQPDMGLRLPADVRVSLLEMGTACNQAAVHLHQALTFMLHIESALESQRTAPRSGPLMSQVTGDLQVLADQHLE